MKRILITLSIMLLYGLTNSLKAQPPTPGGGDNPGPSCFPPPCVPIDGGLSWLLIAGTVYGGKKLYNANKEHKEEL